jgi:hypothetical protein
VSVSSGTERWTGDTVVAGQRAALTAEYTHTVTALKAAAERPVTGPGAESGAG